MSFLWCAVGSVRFEQKRLNALGLGNSFVREGRVEEPRLVALSTNQEIPLGCKTLEQIGKKTREEFASRSITLVESVVPRRLSMTQEDERFGLDILVIVLEEGSRVILGFLPFLVLAEKEELKSGEEQLNLGLGSGRVGQKTDNSSDKKGPGET